jgi:hypothetical protein
MDRLFSTSVSAKRFPIVLRQKNTRKHHKKTFTAFIEMNPEMCSPLRSKISPKKRLIIIDRASAVYIAESFCRLPPHVISGVNKSNSMHRCNRTNTLTRKIAIKN